MVKIRDIHGKDYIVCNIDSFIEHIEKFHTVNGIPDNSIHAVSYTHLTLPTTHYV